MSDTSVGLYSFTPPWKNGLRFVPWALLVAVLIFGNLHNQADFAYYVDSGHAAMAHQDIYKSSPYNVMPPLFSLVCVPLARLSDISSYAALFLWSLLNVVALFVLLDLVCRLTFSGKLPTSGGIAGLPLSDRRVFVPLLLTLIYIINNSDMHQINLFIFLLVLAGLYLQETGRPIWGGISIGVGVALKVMPVLFVPYLMWQRRWRAAWATIGAAATLSLSPILALGGRRYWHYAISWFGIAQGARFNPGFGNQSVLALWDRIIGYKRIPFVSPALLAVPWSGQPWVRIAWLLTLAAIAVAVLFVFRGTDCSLVPCHAMEWSAIFMVSTIIGPVTWMHYLVILLLPNSLLYAAWRSPDTGLWTRRISGSVMFLCFLLSLASSYSIVGKLTAQRYLSGSVGTVAVLITLAGVLWLRRESSGRSYLPV